MNTCPEAIAIRAFNFVSSETALTSEDIKEHTITFFEENKKFFLPLLKRAEKYGVNILVENFNKMCIENYYWPDNAHDICELVDYINHPLLKLCWDTGHGNQQPLPQYDALKLLGDRVAAIHVQDNLGFLDDHTMPFIGTLNVDSLMLGLLEIGYNGYFTFEATLMLRTRSIGGGKVPFAPLHIRKKSEELLYEIGKHILTSYGVFEE